MDEKRKSNLIQIDAVLIIAYSVFICGYLFALYGWVLNPLYAILIGAFAGCSICTLLKSINARKAFLSSFSRHWLVVVTSLLLQAAAWPFFIKILLSNQRT